MWKEAQVPVSVLECFDSSSENSKENKQTKKVQTSTFFRYYHKKDAMEMQTIPCHHVVATCLFPKGVMIRTTQIVGSFIVLNGLINILKNVDVLKVGAM